MVLSQINNIKWLKETHLVPRDVFFGTAETSSGPAVELKHGIWNPGGFGMSSYGTSVLQSKSPSVAVTDSSFSSDWVLIHLCDQIESVCSLSTGSDESKPNNKLGVLFDCLFFCFVGFCPEMHSHEGGDSQEID